jgi:hypothetical protein
MSRLVTFVIVGALAWYGYNHYRTSGAAEHDGEEVEQNSVGGDSDSQTAELFSDQSSVGSTTVITPRAESFTCDGRMYCSQMTSCAEATYFLQHCPNVKMDGGRRDGVPCESQWCGIK